MQSGDGDSFYNQWSTQLPTVMLIQWKMPQPTQQPTKGLSVTYPPFLLIQEGIQQLPSSSAKQSTCFAALPMLNPHKRWNQHFWSYPAFIVTSWLFSCDNVQGLCSDISLGALCCGTASGLVCMWKYVPLLKDKAHEPEDCWKMQPSISFSKPITSLMVNIY